MPVGKIAEDHKCSISLIYKALNEVSDTELGNYINSLHLHKPVYEIPQTINDNVNDNVNVNVNDIGAKAPEPSGSPAPKRTRFIKPSLADVKAYCEERGNNVDPERFINYYEANGWHVGKNPMKDWQAAVRTWEQNGFSTTRKYNAREPPISAADDRYDFDAALKAVGVVS